MIPTPILIFHRCLLWWSQNRLRTTKSGYTVYDHTSSDHDVYDRINSSQVDTGISNKRASVFFFFVTGTVPGYRTVYMINTVLVQYSTLQYSS